MLNAANPFSVISRRGVALSILLIFTLSLIFAGNTWAFPRKVLFEDFTSTTCPPCAGCSSLS